LSLCYFSWALFRACHFIIFQGELDKALIQFSLNMIFFNLFEPSFCEIEDYLHGVAARNHTSGGAPIALSVEGRTEEDRPIYLLRIGEGDQEKSPSSLALEDTSRAIFIDAGKCTLSIIDCRTL